MLREFGTTYQTLGELGEALKVYRDCLAIRERLATADRSNTQWQNDLQYSIGRIGGLAYLFVLARDFAGALEAAGQTIALAPKKYGSTRTAPMR